MVTQSKTENQSLYDTDYNLWVLETVEKLQSKDFNAVDLENLIEEVLDLSKRDKRKLESLSIKLIEHLLILEYWESEREKNRGYWQREIFNFRLQILRLLEDSPSLKKHLSEKSSDCYQKGCQLASNHSQLQIDTFIQKPVATIEQILDEDWLP